MLNENDQKLIEKAKALVAPRAVKGGVVKEVGSTLITGQGKSFSGVSLHLSCGIGFCAEHTAISQMVTQTNETIIKIIVAATKEDVLPPCGRCRELMNILDAKNSDTEVIISRNTKVKLKELLPYSS